MSTDTSFPQHPLFRKLERACNFGMENNYLNAYYSQSLYEMFDVSTEIITQREIQMSVPSFAAELNNLMQLLILLLEKLYFMNISFVPFFLE